MVAGYWFLEDADVSSQKWKPPPDLVAFIDNAHKKGKKVVYIGFGSIVVSDPSAMTQCVVEAIVASGVHAILSKGWSDRLHAKKSLEEEAGHPLPSQIYQIASVPHDWLFARIDAACHHGGAGTTGASLRGAFGPRVVSLSYLLQLAFLRSLNPFSAISSFGQIGWKPWASDLG